MLITVNLKIVPKLKNLLTWRNRKIFSASEHATRSKLNKTTPSQNTNETAKSNRDSKRLQILWLKKIVRKHLEFDGRQRKTSNYLEKSQLEYYVYSNPVYLFFQKNRSCTVRKNFRFINCVICYDSTCLY